MHSTEKAYVNTLLSLCQNMRNHARNRESIREDTLVSDIGVDGLAVLAGSEEGEDGGEEDGEDGLCLARDDARQVAQQPQGGNLLSIGDCYGSSQTHWQVAVRARTWLNLAVEALIRRHSFPDCKLAGSAVQSAVPSATRCGGV